MRAERIAASHATAARLLGIEGVPFEAIEIVTIRERRARLAEVVVHRSYLLGTHDHRRQHGIACTSPVRTVVDLSGRHTTAPARPSSVTASRGNDLVLVGWRLLRIVDGMTDREIAHLVAGALGHEATPRVAS